MEVLVNSHYQKYKYQAPGSSRAEEGRGDGNRGAGGCWRLGTICIQKTSTSVMFHIFSPVSTVSRRPAEPLGVMLYWCWKSLMTVMRQLRFFGHRDSCFKFKFILVWFVSCKIFCTYSFSMCPILGLKVKPHMRHIFSTPQSRGTRLMRCPLPARALNRHHFLQVFASTLAIPGLQTSHELISA